MSISQRYRLKWAPDQNNWQTDRSTSISMQSRRLRTLCGMSQLSVSCCSLCCTLWSDIIVHHVDVCHASDWWYCWSDIRLITSPLCSRSRHEWTLVAVQPHWPEKQSHICSDIQSHTFVRVCVCACITHVVETNLFPRSHCGDSPPICGQNTSPHEGEDLS